MYPIIEDQPYSLFVDSLAEIERLQAQVAEKCDAPVGWINPDKYKAVCESKMEFFKTIKELREQNDRFQARVAMLEEVIADAQLDACNALDPDYVPKEVELAMVSLFKRCKSITGESDPSDIEASAFVLRKQAEAITEMIGWLEHDCNGWAQDAAYRVYWHDKQILNYADELRNEAEKVVTHESRQ